MRWLRLFLLGLASIYPLYWTAQFALFFLPASLRAVFFRLPLRIGDISFLRAAALAGESGSLPVGVEPLLFALLFSIAIWYLRGDRFLTGGLAIVILGQSALLPLLSRMFSSGGFLPALALEFLLSMGLLCFGLYRILSRACGADFVDRLALLSLFVVLPESALWLAFRLHYPFVGTSFLLTLLLPLYLGALIASALPNGLARDRVSTARTPAPMGEILASLLVGCLLFCAIGLSSRSGERQPTNSPFVSSLTRLAINPLG